MLKQMGKEILKLLFKKPSKRDVQDAFYDEEMRDEMRRVYREQTALIRSFSDPEGTPFTPDDPSNDVFGYY